jgi:adenosylhomocysteine nucleosidase
MTMAKTNKGCGPIGTVSRGPVELLVCFAVKEEARFFVNRMVYRLFPRYRLPGREDLSSAAQRPLYQMWITGMGRRNAVEGLRKALEMVKPKRVITSGFAGGLNPKLKFGTIVYDEDFEAGFGPQLEQAGAVRATFYCHRRVAITAREKAGLWQSTGADAVEMESSVIRNICREQKIPGATIRVISDDAGQDLPLDFNAMMTPEDRIHYPKLIWAVLSRPSRIGQMMEFQRRTVEASRRLGEALAELLGAKHA